MPTDIGYTGQRGNLEVGLLFYRARLYAPSLGRFLSADTMVPEAGNPQQFNRYAYARNNPLKYVDPSGHKADEGCNTLGCASDENWAVNLLRAVAQTAGFSNSIDESLVQLALGFFQWSVEHYTLEAGPMTLGDAARDAWQATRTFVQNTGRTPAEALALQRSLGNLFDFTLVAGAMMATEHFKAGEYEFVKGYLRNPLRWEIGKQVLRYGRQVTGNFPKMAGSNEILYRTSSTGKLTNYQVYDINGNPVMRVDLTGRAHGGVAIPHVIEFEQHIAPDGTVYFKPSPCARPAYPSEIP
jgi:RHS repeat-associated protein